MSETTLKITTCSNCGQQMFVDVMYIDTTPYCVKCYHKLFCIKCDSCGDYFLTSNITKTPDTEENFCPDCINDDYHQCDSCNNLCLNTDTVCVEEDNIELCQECFQRDYALCSNCNEVILRDDSSTVNHRFYCDACFDELFRVCDICNETFDINDMAYNNSDECVCPECYIEEEDTSLYDYSYTPTFHYYGNGIDHLYFGIELEIENYENSDYLSDINNNNTILYAKADGSIDSGLEVVSHPTTFKYFNDNFDTVWLPILKSKEYGYRSYNTTTCGIHIHIDKRAFSTLHLYKFMRFFYENDSFITRISQRKIEKLREWASNENTGQDIIYKAKTKHGNENRYSAINLQPYHTIEIRIFRGTLEVSSFRKNIEFLHALYCYTKNAGISKITETDFRQYVLTNKKQYNLI